MILIEENIEETIKTAEHLRTVIYEESNLNIEIPKFSCSFGIVDVEKFNLIEECIIEVDKKLYESKNNGRNKTSY